MSSHFYAQPSTALRRELAHALPSDLLREPHRKSAARRVVLAARQFARLVENCAPSTNWQIHGTPHESQTR